MTEEKLNIWWNGLGYSQLYRLIYIPEFEDDNDFIEKCDEYWESLSVEEKLKLYDYYETGSYKF